MLEIKIIEEEFKCLNCPLKQSHKRFSGCYKCKHPLFDRKHGEYFLIDDLGARCPKENITIIFNS